MGGQLYKRVKTEEEEKDASFKGMMTMCFGMCFIFVLELFL